MRTVIETPTFQKQAAQLWADEELEAFVDWIAANPEAGEVIPGADGARKVRWGRAAAGKRGGVRVVYFSLTARGEVLLVMLYAKADRENVTPGEIEKTRLPDGH